MQEGTKSFSPVVISRILQILTNEGPMKRTSLAGKTRLNYLVLTKYIDLLKALNWVVTIDYAGGSSDVSITEIGMRFNRLISDYLKNSGQNTLNEWAKSIMKVPLATARLGSNLSDNQYFNDLSFDEVKGAIRELGLEHKGDASDNESGSNQKTIYRKCRVLLVDDEPDSLLTYRVILQSAGHQVSAYQDPVEAFQDFTFQQKKQDRYDIIMTDIRMPNVNGLQIYQQVRKIDRKISFVFLTALDAANELLSILPDVESFQILRKPVKQQVLLSSLDRVMLLNS